MKYDNFQRNHAIIPGREKALEDFLNQEYEGLRHKWNKGFSSNSEDALTWSCFEVIADLPLNKKVRVLDEILEDAYEGKCNFSFKDKKYPEEVIKIFVGKVYNGETTKESTEVDASIELPDKLIFFEAKLYESISLSDQENNKPYDQIARKLRVGLDRAGGKEFYFIFLDIAPRDKLYKFSDEKKSKENAMKLPSKKWKNAWWFNYYKLGRNKSLKPLRDILNGIQYEPNYSVESVAHNMGWLTWSDIYKSILRGMIMP
jgi:hypothetical protein